MTSLEDRDRVSDWKESVGIVEPYFNVSNSPSAGEVNMAYMCKNVKKMKC